MTITNTNISSFEKITYASMDAYLDFISPQFTKQNRQR